MIKDFHSHRKGGGRKHKQTTQTKEKATMNASSVKRLANLNGAAVKKTISMNKTLVAGDDKATVELVRQLGTVVNDMTTVINRYEGEIASLPMPVVKDVEEIPLELIQMKIEERIPKELDVLKTRRNNGKVTVYFEPTMKQTADDADVDVCKNVVKDAGMNCTGGRIVDDGLVIAVELETDNAGNPILSDEVDDDEVGNIPSRTEYDRNRPSDIPTREEMLAVMTKVVARAVDVVNRHTGDQDPSVRKLESAIGFKHDLKFLMKHRFEVGTDEYAQAKYLYGTIKGLEDMVVNGKYVPMSQVPAYNA